MKIHIKVVKRIYNPEVFSKPVESTILVVDTHNSEIFNKIMEMVEEMSEKLTKSGETLRVYVTYDYV